MKHFICDKNAGRSTVYIPRGWDTAEEAAAELADLLMPYPPRHEWRRRLRVELRDEDPIAVNKQRRSASGRAGAYALQKIRQATGRIVLPSSKARSKSVETVAAQ
jgi:hypothetical protein